jgi:hypothetical protein
MALSTNSTNGLDPIFQQFENIKSDKTKKEQPKYKKIGEDWYELVDGKYVAVSTNPDALSGYKTQDGKDLTFGDIKGKAGDLNLDSDGVYRQNVWETKEGSPLGYSDFFQGLNKILDITQFVGGTINDAKNTQDERQRLLKAQYPKSMYNINEGGLNNIPAFFKTGGSTKNDKSIAAAILNQGNIAGKKLTPKQKKHFEAVLDGKILLNQHLKDSKKMGTYATGGNVSIVDFLDSKNLDSSKTARKELAKKYGINNYNGTAEQNIKLLNILQNNKNMPAKQQIKNDPFSLIKRVYDEQVNYDARNLESGVIVDRNTNKEYVVKNGKLVESFPVLTGKSRNGANRNDYSSDYLETNPEARVTPTGTYLMRPSTTYGEKSFSFNPISAYGEDAPLSKNIYNHVTYPGEFEQRNPLYTQSPENRAVSLGCINCRKPDINRLTNEYFPGGDTAIVIDSRNPKDLKFIKSLENSNGKRKYATGGEVGFMSLVDYMKASGRDSSVEGRKALAKELGITNYNKSAAHNREILKNLVAQDSASKQFESAAEIVNPETGEIDVPTEYMAEPQMFVDNRTNKIRDAYDAFYSPKPYVEYKKESVKQNNNPTVKTVAEKPKEKLYDFMDYMHMMPHNPNAVNWNSSTAPLVALNKDGDTIYSSNNTAEQNKALSKKFTKLRGTESAISEIPITGLSRVNILTKLPAFARLIRAKTLVPFAKTVGNPMMEGLTLENIFSGTNRFMPSVKKVVAQAKYDANKLAQLAKSDAKVAKLLEDAAQEEQILQSGVGATRKAFSEKRAIKNANDLYERSSFKTGGSACPICGGKMPCMKCGGKPKMAEGGQPLPQGEELMQILQMFAEMNNMTIEELMAKLQQLPEEEMQKAIEDIVDDVMEAQVGEQENEGQEENYEEEDEGEMEIEEMAFGGIPEHYRNKGFNKVGVKRKSTRPGKKWMVLAKKGNKYKVIHGGYVGMQDYTQHRSKDRRENFWNRMGGKNSSKASDPFSPLYWHKKFGTWQTGGEPDETSEFDEMLQNGELMEVGGVPRNEANGELEQGEVYQDNEGMIKKVAESEPTHEDGGSPQPDVHRVLEDTADKRKDLDSIKLKIKPEEAYAIVGFKPKSTKTHSKLFEEATAYYDKQTKSLENKIKTNLEYVKYGGGKFAQNSLDENLKLLSKLPTKANLFDAIYNHQEEVKQRYNIGQENNPEMQYGGLKLFGNGGDDLPSWFKYWTKSKTPQGSKSPAKGLPSTYSPSTGNEVYDDYKYWKEQYGKDFKSPAEYQTFVFNQLMQDNPEEFDKIRTEYGMPAAGTLADSIFGARTAKASKYRLKTVPAPVENTTTSQDGTAVVPESTTPTPGTTTPTTSGDQQTKPKGVTSSTFNEPLRWYDVAGNLSNYLSSLEREPVGLEQYKFTPLQARELNPLPTLLENQGTYNAAMAQLPQSGVGYANIANLAGGKYAATNQVLGQYENINKGKRDAMDQYNAQQKMAIEQANMGLRDQFTQRVLQGKEIQRQSKLNAFDDYLTKIAQNRKLNREGNLLSKMYPYFDQEGNFNGNILGITNAVKGSGATVQQKKDSKGNTITEVVNKDGNVIASGKTKVATK